MRSLGCMVPLLPLVLMVTVIAVRHGNRPMLAVLAVGLLLWLRQPCLLPFPNLWTVGGLMLFAACAVAAPKFRAETGDSHTQPR